MNPEAIALMGAILLGIVHVTLQSASMTAQLGAAYNVGARDEGRTVQGVAARLERASKNFQETFPLFAAAVLWALGSGHTNLGTQLGAWLYLAARVTYLPLYAAGVRYWRTVTWTMALAGLLLVLFGACFSALS